MKLNRRRSLQFLLTLLAFTPYLLYVWYVITTSTAPIDYDTFMEIGRRVVTGAPVYGGNSYYPMPYAMVFGLFSLLPRPLSLGLWLLIPVVLAWLISGRKAWVLLFAPLFGNFLGGQSAVFGMLGVWGYRRQPDLERYSGGLWLALLAFKPQLAVFPTLYACWQWWTYLRGEHKIPKQALGWAAGGVVYYLVGVLLGGFGWVFDWLGNPRPESLRAQAGILPRSLIELGVQPPQPLFWVILAVGGLALFVGAWLWNRRRMPFDLWLKLSALVNPLMHDYDLIQLIPLIDTPLRRKAALLASIPLWLVILFAYQNDAAWYAVTFIPLVLAGVALIESRRISRAVKDG